MLTGSADNTARLWDARSGKPLGEPLRHENSVTAVAFSPEGDRVLTGSEDNDRAALGRPLGQAPGRAPAARELRFRPPPSAPRGTGC